MSLRSISSPVATTLTQPSPSNDLYNTSYNKPFSIIDDRECENGGFVICDKDESSLQNNSPSSLNYFLNYSSSPSSLSLVTALANLSATTSVKDISLWSSKEFSILASALEKFIPFIRFLQISSSDFYKKVKPFNSILPFDLYDDILQYHLVPDSVPHDDLSQPERAAIDSVIIERKHAALIASWIDGRGLCNDDSNNEKSHDNCTSSSPTGSRNIMSRVRDPARAINYYKNYGPSFGRDDLKMAGNFKLDSRCCCKQGDYELPIRENTGYFSVDEYEVFSIHRRRPLGKEEDKSIGGFNNSLNDGENKSISDSIGIAYQSGRSGNMTRSLTY
ncbi:22528_t:CDS:2 [Dentiscutata erythropus]|uniref:22528_t:CDS:1 n=1 Tax=Dentiscutata erythropus TaxID=1348616 RepID=A0A9N9GUF0_9GLOM|nr:22528_t:CDS:2 [Dentiscutata erythropus]